MREVQEWQSGELISDAFLVDGGRRGRGMGTCVFVVGIGVHGSGGVSEGSHDGERAVVFESGFLALVGGRGPNLRIRLVPHVVGPVVVVVGSPVKVEARRDP